MNPGVIESIEFPAAGECRLDGRTRAPRVPPVSTWAIRGRTLALLLIAAVLAVYFARAQAEFIVLDDPDYVTDNPRVLGGLTAEGFRWAFTTGHAANWHPVTWLSHQLDATAFGASPIGPHLVNVILHALTSALLLLWLNRVTSRLWLSATIAALFALHPLRVESVAWVAERKDVLSAFWFLLTLHAYTRFAQTEHARTRVRRGWYALAVAAAAVALMAKPMVVTLPCVLLLVDVWPLNRIRATRWSALLLEKLPFLALSAAVSAITLHVQGQAGAIRSLATFTFQERFANAVVAVGHYLAATCWPRDLAVFYPHPGRWPNAVVLLSAAAIASMTTIAVALRRTVPAVLIGWLWWLGMLVPTLGLVQVGYQACADRYTYLPSIGLTCAVVFAAARLASWLRVGAGWRAAAGVTVILASAATTVHALSGWRNSGTLFARALAVTNANFVAADALGCWRLDAGDAEGALTACQQAAHWQPRFAPAHYHAGLAALRLGRNAEALAAFERATAVDPAYSVARFMRGAVLRQTGWAEEAARELSVLVVTEPSHAAAHRELGHARLALGETKAAAAEYRRAAQLMPRSAEPHNDLGSLYQREERVSEAADEFKQALALEPNHAGAHYNLGLLALSAGDLTEAIAHLTAAAAAAPADGDAEFNLASACAAAGEIDEAVWHLRTALRLHAGPAAHENLAILLAHRGQAAEAEAHRRTTTREGSASR
jgi:Flp pilus assembly protein TadD